MYPKQFHGNGVYTYQNGLKLEGKWIMGLLDGTTRVTSADVDLRTTMWTFSKLGISMTCGDITLTTEPLPELPRRFFIG